jgi:hypothetical protein
LKKMNCFEARQQFRALWRKTAPREMRAALLAHLQSCAKCNHAFRVFAVTAPALHSDSKPPEYRTTSAVREFSPHDRPHRFASLSRSQGGTRQLFVMCAALAIFALSGTVAYWVDRAPDETVADAISDSDSVLSPDYSQDSPGADLSVADNDLAR